MDRTKLMASVISFGLGFSSAEAACPISYSSEQSNVIGHIAYIGVAGENCPNFKRNVRPLLGYLAAAWGTFDQSEFDCKIWSDTYAQSADRAGISIARGGLKSFCSKSLELYGPNGTLVEGALTIPPD